jgi:hypothetical protein
MMPFRALLACCLSLTAGCLSATPGNADATEGAVGDDAAGTRTCSQAVRCAQDKGCYQPLCVGTCLAGTDLEAKQQAQAILQCEADRCTGIGMGMESTLALCVYDECRKEMEPCTTSGTESCQATLVCLETSLYSGGSSLDCLDSATYEARLHALAVTACVENECPYAIASGTDALAACLGNQCGSEFSNCM